MEIVVPVPAEVARDREAMEAFKTVVPQMLRDVVFLRRAKSADTRRRAVELLLDGAKPRPLDMDRARLEVAAFRSVFEGAQWLTAQQVAELAGTTAATVNRWKQERKLFAIRQEGVDYYPRYSLGADFKPLPVIAEVMKVLKGHQGEILAVWFEGTSSFLAGKRPRELVQVDPARVLAAAEDKVDAETFAG